MRKKSLAAWRRRSILTGSENNVFSIREGHRVNRLRRFPGRVARVDAHIAKVSSKTRLEEGAFGPRQGLPAASKGSDLRMQRGRRSRGPAMFFLSSQLSLFLAFWARRSTRAGLAFALDRRSRGGSHDAVRDMIGFPLKRIVGAADRQLGLNRPSSEQVLDRQIAEIGRNGFGPRRGGASASRPRQPRGSLFSVR
jgi:hypothetical protein